MKTEFDITETDFGICECDGGFILYALNVLHFQCARNASLPKMCSMQEHAACHTVSHNAMPLTRPSIFVCDE